MQDTFLEVTYNTLGQILQDILSEHEIQTSESLRKKVQDAILCHRDLKNYYDGVIQEKRLLGQQVWELTASKVIDTERLTHLIERYKSLHDFGANERVIYELAKTDFVDGINLIKVLTRVFALSWDEGQVLVHRFEQDEKRDS